MDIEEFLELRKNTGDDRRRTHDMNTANWVPDLFMKKYPKVSIGHYLLLVILQTYMIYMERILRKI